MRRLTALLTVTLAALLLIGSAAPVAAQQNTTATPNGNASSASPTERIDANTVLLDSGYNASSGIAYVEIRSSTLQQVTIVDGSYMMLGGEATTRTQTLRPNESTIIELPVKKVEGYVSLSIGTPNTLYGELIQTDGSIFGGSASWSTVQVAGATGFAGGFVAILLVSYLQVRGLRSEVSRVT